MLFFKDTPDLEILKLGGQNFCFNLMQFMENRIRLPQKFKPTFGSISGKKSLLSL